MSLPDNVVVEENKEEEKAEPKVEPKVEPPKIEQIVVAPAVLVQP